MTIINTYAAETWDKVYTAFQQINFTSYDYDTVKESLLQYLQIYHAEDFNDFIESSELIAILETFAYAAELMAYRTDTVAHENFISTAQRKQSVLRLAKLISYSASRNIPARGLVKLNSIRTSEQVFDSLGNNLANKTITWNDPNNSNWKEQFFLVMNLVLTARFGQPSKSFQIGDVLMQMYTLNNTSNSFRNGVFAFSATGSAETVSMEVVPADIDENGPYERDPDMNAQMNILYASDGRGDGSDYSGFLMFVKQGNLIVSNYEISEPIPNRRLVLNQNNVNDTDVWVYSVNDNQVITKKWRSVPSLADQTLSFNNLETRYKYEIETLENDQIALIFGDGNFAEIPKGRFQLWTRVSVNQDITIPKNRISGQAMSFSYTNQQNNTFTCSLTFSLTSALQNNSPSETIEHVRQAAPATYYAQNRMVNGQDHNTFMLRDPTILKLSTINRTFAGQPKYLEWNDASGAYQNIKLFGDDLALALKVDVSSTSTTTSSKGLIDSYIEPVLSSNGILNTLVHQMSTAFDYIDAETSKNIHAGYGIITYPRRKFIEDNRKIYKTIDGDWVTPYGRQLDGTPLQIGDGSLLEKTVIQGALDGRWYGEPKSTVTINGTLHGVIPDPVLNPESSGRLYTSDLPRTIDGVNTYPPGDTGSGVQSIQRQRYFGLKYNQFLKCFGNGTLAISAGTLNPLPEFTDRPETLTIEMQSDGTTFSVISNLRGRLPNYSMTLAAATANRLWSQQTDTTLPVDFSISAPTDAFEAGDAFVIDIWYQLATGHVKSTTPDTLTDTTQRWANNTWQNYQVRIVSGTGIGQTRLITANTKSQLTLDSNWTITPDETSKYIIEIISKPEQDAQKFSADLRRFGASEADRVNLTGWWELIPDEVVNAPENKFSDPGSENISGLGLFNSYNDGPDALQRLAFNQSSSGGSWIFLIARKDDEFGNVQEWTVYNRDMRIIASSASTKFWFNQESQIIDSETLKPLYDKIRILRSNLDEYGAPLRKAQIYDCVGFVYSDDGEPITNSLEVLPTDTINFTQAGDKIPDNILQFHNLARQSYRYSLYSVSNSGVSTFVRELVCGEYTYCDYDQSPYDIGAYDRRKIKVIAENLVFDFEPGNLISENIVPGYRLVRELYVPSKTVVRDETLECNETTGLDFMWQHYTPNSNLIDPSVSNIHDTYILSRGYYSSMMNFVRGISNIEPSPPTPLELRTSYGYLLENKMLSDTIVLHPGKIKLLFGSLADQRLRAKFRVVVSPTATMSAERIKQEIINVVNTYFNIADWDFGDTFYATELLSLIHQALPTQISSVVIVPTFSVNSFGSLFTINSGLDEVLQSCATVSDVEIVSALTPSMLRQNM